jgi:hypothetical protein
MPLQDVADLIEGGLDHAIRPLRPDDLTPRDGCRSALP